MVVVSPDVGCVARARAFAQKLGMGLAIVDKRRQKANSSEVMNIIGDVAGKHVILSGRHGGHRRIPVPRGPGSGGDGRRGSVTACASHGLLDGPAIERINASPIQELALLNTLPTTFGEDSDKVKYLSVAPMFAEAIERIYQEISIAKLFN